MEFELKLERKTRKSKGWGVVTITTASLNYLLSSSVFSAYTYAIRDVYLNNIPLEYVDKKDLKRQIRRLAVLL